MTRASDLARLIGAGATINDGTTITTDDNTAQLELVSTDADSGIGPHQVFYRNSSSPADSDLLCELDFRGRNDNSQDVNYATVNVKANDVTDGEEDGEYILQVMTAGSVDTTMHIKPAEIVFNEDSIDRDFRVESNGETHALFVQAGADCVGIKTTSPNDYYADDFVVTAPDEGGMTIVQGTASKGYLAFADGTSGDAAYRGYLGYDHALDTLYIASAGTERLFINSTGQHTIACNKASGYALYVNNDGNDQNRYGIRTQVGSDDGSGTSYSMGFADGDGNSVGSITHSGGSTSFNTSSDYRLKENVNYDFDATTRLKELKPCRFNFIGQKETVDGFLAHEVTAVPEAIVGEKDAMTEEVLYTDDDAIPEGKKVGDVKEASKIDPQGMDQSKLVPLLVKTIQELEARISSQETNINDLQKRVTALEGS